MKISIIDPINGCFILLGLGMINRYLIILIIPFLAIHPRRHIGAPFQSSDTFESGFGVFPEWFVQ